MAPSYPPPHCQTTDLESGLQDESAVNPGGTTPPESATLNGSNDSVHTNNANPEISYRDIPIYREVLRDNADGVKSILKSTQSTNFTEIQRRGKLGETILHVAILNCKTKVAAMLINDYGDEQVVLQEAPNVGGRTESTRLIDVCYGVGKTRELFYEPSSQIPVSVPWGVIDNYFDDSTIHESQQEPKVQETENSSSQRLETESVGSMSTHYVLKTEKKAIYKLEEKKAIIPPKLLEPVSCLKCYLGETALHLACKNRMTEIVEFLLKEKAKWRHVKGYKFFRSDGYPKLYSGSTPFHFAATQHCAKTNDIDELEESSDEKTRQVVELLMSHRPDCLYEADFYGNNVLHIMAYYGIFNDVFQLICERNQTDLETLSPKAYNLLQHKNIYGQTPCQLGLSCGHPSTLKALKRIQWKFGVEFVQYCVVLNEICPVLFEKGSSQDSPVVENTTGQIVQPKSSLSAKDTDISKPILVYVVDDLIPNERTFKIIDHSILKSVIYVKWSLYARRYYLWKWFLSSIMVGSFTLAILTASNDKSNTNLSQLVLAAITAAFALQGLNDLVKRINSLYSNEIELRKRANNAKNLLIKYSDPSESGTLESGTLESGTSESKISDSETISWIDSGKILWKILQTDLDEDIVLVTFYITAISAFILILMGKYKPGVNDWLCWAHAWGLLFGWLHFLYYLQGMRGVGPLIYVLRKQIRSSFVQWLVIYAIVTIGFATSFFSIMKDTNNGQDTSSDWNSLMGSILWTVRFTYNMSDFDTMRNQAGYLAILIYLIYMLLVVILLLNMLIAMMNDSFTTISAHKKTQWLMQMARIIVKIDRTLSDNDKTLIKNDFGYHFNPKSEVTPSENTKWIQKGVDDVTTPVTRLFEKSNTSHDTQLDNKSREDGLKYGPFIGDSHVFLFLDKVGESGKWETIQLITGRRTGKDNEFVDFEFKLNSHDYWSLLNVACDFYYMFFNSQSLLNRYAKYD